MSNIIEIKHQDSQGKSAVELIDLLNLIAQDQQQLVWSILDLEAIGDLSPIWERGILDLEENIRNLPQGLILSWQMLILLVEKFDQVINIIIVGCQEITKIPSLKPNSDLDTPCEIVLELIDSSLWRIYAKDQKILQRLQQEFSRIREIEALLVG